MSILLSSSSCISSLSSWSITDTCTSIYTSCSSSSSLLTSVSSCSCSVSCLTIDICIYSCTFRSSSLYCGTRQRCLHWDMFLFDRYSCTRSYDCTLSGWCGRIHGHRIVSKFGRTMFDDRARLLTKWSFASTIFRNIIFMRDGVWSGRGRRRRRSGGGRRRDRSSFVMS